MLVTVIPKEARLKMAAILGQNRSGGHFYYVREHVCLTRANGNPYLLSLSLADQSECSTSVAPLLEDRYL